MEFVYVVPRDALFPDCYPQGLTRFGAPAGADLEPTFTETEVLDSIAEHGFFVERPYAERSPHLKQIIPYTLVVAESPVEGPRVLCVRRLPQGGEQRLVGKLSIGIGGHINPIDGATNVIAAGTERELDEELFLSGARRLTAVGLINDDSNPVGAVHVGLVQVLSLAAGGEQDVRVREEEVLEGNLVQPAELTRQLESHANFETWSRMLVERIDELLSLPQPALS
jgi:predicted NUDIX family phosphoesterase